MRPDDLPAALLAFIAIVALLPSWTHYLGEFTASRPEHYFIAALVLPAVIALFATSWVRPELAGPLVGVFVLVCVMVLAPWFWQFSGMAASQLADHPFAQLMIRLALPVVVLAFAVGLGYRRVAAR